MKAPNWTATEENILRAEYAKGTSVKTIAGHLLNRTPAAIHGRAVKLGLIHQKRLQRNTVWPKVKNVMRRRSNIELTTREIADMTGISLSAINKALRVDNGKTVHWVRTKGLDGKGYKTHVWQWGAGAVPPISAKFVPTTTFDPITAALFGR